MTKPFSQACENNKKPILLLLNKVFSKTKQVLEIGSGTGQHAVYFARNLPHLQWQTSDLLINHSGINLWLDEIPLANLHRPLSLDLSKMWSVPNKITPIDAIFTANTLHIISWPLVIKFFEGIALNLATKGLVAIYGPFNYQGEFISKSNENFDLWLKDRDINSGIRDIEAITKLADSVGLILMNDYEMPANNRLLVFIKQ